jgi:hypothetical protein
MFILARQLRQMQRTMLDRVDPVRTDVADSRNDEERAWILTRIRCLYRRRSFVRGYWSVASSTHGGA